MPVTPDGSAQRRMADKPYRYKAPNERECAEDCDRHHHVLRPLVREYRRIGADIVRSVRDCDGRHLENSAGGCLASSLAPAQVQQLPYSETMGATPSKPTCAGENARAAKAAVRLIATMVVIPRICPPTMRRREKLRSEKKPTKRTNHRYSSTRRRRSTTRRAKEDSRCRRLPVSAAPPSRTIRSGRVRPHGGNQALERRRDVVAQHRHPPIAFRSDPVELDDPAFAGEGLVAMPRIVGPFERQQRSLGRGHLHDHVVEVISRFEQAQAAAGILPSRVHVNEDRNDLAFRIGVDPSILRAALTANRCRGRPPCELEAELLFERLAEVVALQFGDEF